MKAKITQVRNLTSQKGKAFTVLQLQLEDGSRGDLPVFDGVQYVVGDVVEFTISLNFRYQITLGVKKC